MYGRDFSEKADREQFWREHVSRWETSGQSIVGYCLQHGINEKTFHTWKSKFIRRSTQVSQPEGKHTFVEVQMPFRSEASLEVSLSNGHKILVHPGFDEATFSRVVALLERAVC